MKKVIKNTVLTLLIASFIAGMIILILGGNKWLGIPMAIIPIFIGLAVSDDSDDDFTSMYYD